MNISFVRHIWREMCRQSNSLLRAKQQDRRGNLRGAALLGRLPRARLRRQANHTKSGIGALQARIQRI